MQKDKRSLTFTENKTFKELRYRRRQGICQQYDKSLAAFSASSLSISKLHSGRKEDARSCN